MARIVIVLVSLLVLASGSGQAQSRREGPPPGHGRGGAPGQVKKDRIAAPEFDVTSAGAAIALVIGGSLVLLETRRRKA